MTEKGRIFLKNDNKHQKAVENCVQYVKFVKNGCIIQIKKLLYYLIV